MDILNINWKWEDMCGPEGFHPWNDTSKDFGYCFQELCLQVPVFFITAIVSAYYLGYRNDWVIREKPQDRALVLRSFIVLALVFIPIIDLYVLITEPGYVLYPIVYFVAGASCLCWLVHFGYVLALRHRLGPSSRGPTSLLVCWGAAVVLNILSLRSNSMTGASIASDIATLCCHGLYLLTLVPHSQTRQTYYSPCLVGSRHNHNEYTPLLPHIDDGILGTAMQGAGLWSKLTFSWVEPLFLKGLENKLDDPEELFDVPANVGCSYVGARIDKALIGNVDIYQQYVEVPHEPFISSGYGATGESVPQSSTPVTPNSRVLVRPARRQNVTLFRALHSCFAVQFYSIGVLKFTSDMAGFAGPMLLNKLVTFVQDGSMDIHYGYMYAGGLLASTLTQAIFNSHFNWNMALIGIKMQGAIVSTILRKTLSVTSTELNKVFSLGEITNFMSTDTDRIVNSCPSFHALWSIPLQLFITLFLLYQQVGISFLAGVGFSVVLIPINKVIANKIGRLSTELMRHKDARVNFVTDMLKGIRTVKMHVWEDYFINRVNDARTLELRYLRLRKLLDALCVVLWATTPVLVAALTLGVHALRGATLDAPTVFTTVALVNMLISPLNAFPWVLNGLTEAWVSVKRIQKLLELPDMDPERYYDRLNTNRDEEKMIIFNNASFSWAKPSDKKKPPPKTKKNKGKSKRKTSKANLQRRDSLSSIDAVPSDQPFTLRNINLDIGREDFIGIAGPVGSGKTSLLHAIIGDMIKKGGDIQIPEHLDSFGYVSQSAWLVRGTIRDNILFGKPYDEAKFRAVVDACALTEDMNVLGWAAAAGDGGCTLSGGQRARVALARAVYQDKQVYLLDDVLSGVDTRVAQHIMQRCILGLLKRTTRVLVAHSPKHLARANTVLLMKDGKIVKQGPPETVLNDIEEYLPSETESIGEEPAQAPPKDDDPAEVASQDSLAQYEGMSQGTVRWWVVGLYLRSIGFFLSTAIVLSLILMQVSQNFTFLWLAYWVKNRASNATTLEITHENTTFLDHGFNAIDTVIHSIINGTLFKREANVNATKLNEQLGDETLMPNSDIFYLEVYFGLAGLNVVFTVMRAFLFAYGGVQAATRMHRMLLKTVVKAEVKFFDTTPLGRIVNRFSSDTYTVDDSLPFILNILLAQLFSLVGALSVTLYGVPYVAVALVPLLPVYYWLQRRYRVSSRQLKRLQSVTLTPVYSHFSDTLQGLTSIRALGAGARWLEKGSDSVERSQRAALSAAAAAAWLALRLQGAAAALCAAAALAPLHSATAAGLVGLALSYALSLTSMVSGVMNAFTETEREMIAVERVGEYIREIEVEKIDGDPPPYGWPTQGVIEFKDVVLKYSDRPSAAPALNGVSFSTYSGERVGVVGRTGAGKSSLLHALLRTRRLQAGVVAVDNVPLHTMHLHALRSRIGVIPQEPFIFTGTVRENTDPLRIHTDAEISRALERCGAAGEAFALACPAAALSRGQRQLLCLARALLQRAKVLLIDEATANLDQETERLILDALKCSFAGATVLFVAHRVLGVLECARVLVLAQGKVQEYAPPDELLADPTSQLYRLVHAHEE